jgi:hypothetical protein
MSPEVFVHSASLSVDRTVLNVEFSYCGNGDKFEFSLIRCFEGEGSAGPFPIPNCYKVAPKYHYDSECEQIVREKISFRFGDILLDGPDGGQHVFIFGDRDTYAVISGVQ